MVRTRQRLRSNFEEQWASIVKKAGYSWSIATLLKIANEADPDWRTRIPRAEEAKPAARPAPNQSAAGTEQTAPATYTGPLLFDPWAPFDRSRVSVRRSAAGAARVRCYAR